MSIKSWNELEEQFDEILDECNEPFKVGNIEYDFSRTWKAIDPIAYRCDLLAYADSEGIDTDELVGYLSVD